MKHSPQVALTSLLLAGLFLFAVPATSQESAGKACGSPEHRAFDFWLGEWDVLTPQGQKAGTNRIERILNGCALLENWTSVRGGSGTSLNFFNSSTRRWEQLWVDDGGGVIQYEGEFKDGAMRFDKGEHVRRDGSRVRSRMTLTALEGGRVRQLIEQSSDDGKTWTLWFDGTYVPHSKAASP
jgi:hypothetical protein